MARGKIVRDFFGKKPPPKQLSANAVAFRRKLTIVTAANPADAADAVLASKVDAELHKSDDVHRKVLLLFNSPDTGYKNNVLTPLQTTLKGLKGKPPAQQIQDLTRLDGDLKAQEQIYATPDTDKNEAKNKQRLAKVQAIQDHRLALTEMIHNLQEVVQAPTLASVVESLPEDADPEDAAQVHDMIKDKATRTAIFQTSTNPKALIKVLNQYPDTPRTGDAVVTDLLAARKNDAGFMGTLMREGILDATKDEKANTFLRTTTIASKLIKAYPASTVAGKQYFDGMKAQIGRMLAQVDETAVELDSFKIQQEGADESKLDEAQRQHSKLAQDYLQNFRQTAIPPEMCVILKAVHDSYLLKATGPNPNEDALAMAASVLENRLLAPQIVLGGGAGTQGEVTPLDGISDAQRRFLIVQSKVVHNCLIGQRGTTAREGHMAPFDHLFDQEYQQVAPFLAQQLGLAPNANVPVQQGPQPMGTPPPNRPPPQPPQATRPVPPPRGTGQQGGTTQTPPRQPQPTATNPMPQTTSTTSNAPNRPVPRPQQSGTTQTSPPRPQPRQDPRAPHLKTLGEGIEALNQNAVKDSLLALKSDVGDQLLALWDVIADTDKPRTQRLPKMAELGQLIGSVLDPQVKEQLLKLQQKLRESM